MSGILIGYGFASMGLFCLQSFIKHICLELVLGHAKSKRFAGLKVELMIRTELQGAPDT